MGVQGEGKGVDEFSPALEVTPGFQNFTRPEPIADVFEEPIVYHLVDGELFINEENSLCLITKQDLPNTESDQTFHPVPSAQALLDTTGLVDEEGRVPSLPSSPSKLSTGTPNAQYQMKT